MIRGMGRKTTDKTPGPDGRIPVNFRARTDSVAWMDEKAARHGLTRTHAIRAALAVAAKHEAEVTKALKQMADNR